jgi:prepilin-type N-terminal cleavage/methylation domain-containing protein
MRTDAVSCSSKGFTLVELLIVVVIMAVLAATVIPEFSSSTDDAKTNTSMFNLHTIRAQLQTYKAQHGGNAPALLLKLTKVTDSAGLEAGEPGAGDLIYGPYLSAIPEDVVNSSTDVATSSDDPISVTSTTGGWIYNSTTGEIRVNHTSYDHF